MNSHFFSTKFNLLVWCLESFHNLVTTYLLTISLPLLSNNLFYYSYYFSGYIFVFTDIISSLGCYLLILSLYITIDLRWFLMSAIASSAFAYVVSVIVMVAYDHNEPIVKMKNSEV